MNGVPAGYSDSDEDSDFEDDYNPPMPIAGTGDGQASHGTKDPWADVAFYNNAPVFPKAKRLTPIDFRDALENGKLDVVKDFLNENSGQDFLNGKVGNFSGDRPIFLACQNGRPEIIEYLCDKGADLGPHKGDGATLLMAVCSSGTFGFNRSQDNHQQLLKCAKILEEKFLERGVDFDVNAVQSQNMTSLMYSSKCGNIDLVDYLISKGAKLDLADTQRWTAICFAADKGHGHVVRLLLEAGANPDVITIEGQTLADLVGHEKPKLLEIVEAAMKEYGDSKVSKNLRNVEANVEGYKKFTELENILLGIDADDYLELFEEHGLNLDQFLTLNEFDLEEIGVKKVGVRKRMVEAICEIHKKDWEKTSLPRITPKDRQRGIYFTCPDGVMMTANISEHLKFLAANVNYLAKSVKEHPELLEIGKDVADLEIFIKHVSTCRSRLTTLHNQVKNLEKVLKKHEHDPRFAPADRIPVKKSTSKPFKYFSLAFVMIAIPVIAFKKFKQ